MIDGKTDNERCVLSGPKVRTCYKGRSAGRKGFTDTLQANRAGCVGMAANMIGVKKRVIIVNMGFVDVVMFNPVLLSKDTPYETEEGCLSLTGVRKTTRYENIEVEYYDMNWKKQRQKLSGWPAQICQHELDHLEGILI